jgi:hypothetical protein
MKRSIKFKTATLPLLIAFALPFVVSLTPSASAQAPPGALWYNGDYADGAGSNANLIGGDGCTVASAVQTYDDFTVPQPFGWNITEVFSDNQLYNSCSFEEYAIIGALWEIRQGVSTGNPGVQIAQGFTVTPVVTATGRIKEYRVEVQGLNFFLSPGTYHLNVTPIVNGKAETFNSIATGTKCRHALRK